MTQKKPTRLIVLFAILLLLAGGTLWWRYVYSDPQRVFNGMLGNSMRLQGISKKVSQTDNGQQVEQVTQVEMGAETRILSNTRLTQLGNDPTVVVTQTIGTPMTDYTRYVSVDTKQTKADGTPLNFNNILGIWGSSSAGQKVTFTNGQLYNETVLGVIPFGNLNQIQRQKLQEQIRKDNVYEVDYKHVGRSIEAGRPTYTYQVTVDAEAYIKLLKQFGDMIGLNNLGDLDPSQYAGAERLPFTISVDVWSREVKQITYPNGGDRVEVYSGYNAIKKIDIPTQVVSIEELQTRLQQLQQ